MVLNETDSSEDEAGVACAAKKVKVTEKGNENFAPLRAASYQRMREEKTQREIIATENGLERLRNEFFFLQDQLVALGKHINKWLYFELGLSL